MNSLSVTLCGNGRTLSLKNPIMTASGTFGYALEFAPFGNLKSLGGVIVKGLSLTPREGNPMPRIAETPSGMLNSIGLQNCGLDCFLKEKMPKLKELNAPVIANLYATSAEDFAILARTLAKEDGIIALELNISCPNVKEGGVAFGKSPSMAAKVTEAVMAVSETMPVIVKLSPNVTDIAEIALACEKAGATAISCINTLSGMAIDLHTKTARLSMGVGGLSGPAIKPVALRCVWEVANAISIPVIGIGGIVTAEDVLEYILAGAHAIQIGTANFTSPDTVFSIAENLPKIMAQYAIDDLALLRGCLTMPV